jgi:hypothetical protein
LFSFGIEPILRIFSHELLLYSEPSGGVSID